MSELRGFFIGALLCFFLMTLALSRGWIPSHGSNIEKAICGKLPEPPASTQEAGKVE